MNRFTKIFYFLLVVFSFSCGAVLRADGRSDTIWFLNTVRENMGRAFCVPSTQTVGQTLAIVKKYADKRGLRNITTADVCAAISEVYPCAGNSSAINSGPKIGNQNPGAPEPDSWQRTDQIKFDSLRHSEHASRIIMPIFSQLLSFYLPDGFVPVFENTRGANYIIEFVPKGNTTRRWTQMITVTGVRDLVLEHEDLTAEKYMQIVAGLFRRACPLTFEAGKLLEGNTNGWKTFVGVASCGSHDHDGGPVSETTIFIVIKGEEDIYTLQWAQRGPPKDIPLEMDGDLCRRRLFSLCPIRICSHIPGEMPPYPNCEDEDQADRSVPYSDDTGVSVSVPIGGLRPDHPAVVPPGDGSSINTEAMGEVMARLRDANGHESDKLVNAIIMNPSIYAPPVLFEMSALLYRQGNIERAIFWYNAARLRCEYDALLCTDVSARSAVRDLMDQMPKGLRVAQFDDLKKLKKTIDEVIAWDEATPYRYDHRWISLHGLGAYGLKRKRSELTVPEARWHALAVQNRRDYVRLFEVIIREMNKREESEERNAI